MGGIGRRAAGLAIVLALAGSGAMAETIGKLAVTPVTPAGHVAVPALDETGCRVPMLVWRCRRGALALIYAFDMEIAPEDADALRIGAEQDGRALAPPAAWPLTASHRNATVPAAVARSIVEAAHQGAELHLRLDDPASGSALHDRFDLSGVAAAIAALSCAPE